MQLEKEKFATLKRNIGCLSSVTYVGTQQSAPTMEENKSIPP